MVLERQENKTSMYSKENMAFDHTEICTVEDIRAGAVFQLVGGSVDSDGVIIRWLRTDARSTCPETYKSRITCVRLDTGHLLNISADWEVFRVEYR